MICAECDYDLRGLPAESVCPECGRPIAESLAAGPLTDWRPRFRLGVACLGAAIVAMPFAENLSLRGLLWVGSFSLNRDGLVYLTHALLLFPAAWWMTTPAPFLPADPRRLRPWLLAFTVAQLASAALVIGLLHCLAYWCVVALLATYAFAPFAYIFELWLLLAALASPLPLVRDALPRWVVRGVGYLLVLSLFAYACGFAVIHVARIRQVGQTFPPGGTFLPEPWNARLNDFVLWPASRLQGPAWLACLLVVAHCVFRLGRGAGLKANITWPHR